MGKNITTTNEKRSLDLLTIVGIFSAFLLLTLITIYFYAPVIKTNAAVTGAASAAATVGSVASISVDSTVALDITPSGTSGGTDTEAFTVKVMTNSTNGYILKMAAEGTSASMTSTTSSDTIDSDFSGGDYAAGDDGVAVGSMGTNKWGFSKDGTNFFVVPVTGSEVELENTSSSTANVWNTHTYYFGAHVASSVESGTYTKNVVFTAVAEQRATTFFDIDYMHEMSSDICTNTPTATTKNITEPTPNNTLAEAKTGNYIAQTTLTDYRDMKTYVVRKYANGECWMAQNLETDFFADGDSVADGSSNSGTYSTTSSGKNTSAKTNTAATLGGTITDTTSNIYKWISYSDITDESAFTSTSNAYGAGTFYATQNYSGSSYGWADNGQDGARSYSTPAYVTANPTATMKNYLIKTGSTAGDGYYTFQESASADTTANGGGEWQRVGNYYNFAAAKAGYLGTATGSSPDNSICPRHWTLPAVSGDKSIESLMQYYYGSWTNGGGNTALYNWLNGHPLDFWRTGYYYRSYGTVASRTTDGYWWSSNASSSTDGNALNTLISGSSGYVGSQSSYHRGLGFSVRCVAR